MIANEGVFPEFNQRFQLLRLPVRTGPSLLLKTSLTPQPWQRAPGINPPVHVDILSVSSINIIKYKSDIPRPGRQVQTVYCILNIVIKLNKKNRGLVNSNGQ